MATTPREASSLPETGPIVTIGLAVHNGEEYLDRAIASLLAQTWPHIRLVISDNASDDGTADICQKWARADERVEYIRQGENLGHVGNFEFLARRATTPYFMWAAYDDTWDPAFVEALVGDLEAHPKAVVTMSGVQRICLADGSIEHHRFSGAADPNRMSSLRMLRALIEGKKYHNWIYGLYRTEFLQGALKNGMPRVVGTDRLLMCQVALAHPFRYVDRELFIKYRHPGSFADRHPEDDYLAKSNRAVLKSVFVLWDHLMASDVIPAPRKLLVPLAVSYFAWINRKPVLKALAPRLKRSRKLQRPKKREGEPLKILFVGRSMHLMPYYEPFLSDLLESGHPVVLTIDPAISNQTWESLPRLLGAYPNLSQRPFLRREDGWRKWLFPLRELRSYASYLPRKDQSSYYLDRWRKYLSPFGRKLTRHGWGRWVLGTSFAARMFRRIEKIAPAARNIQAFLAAEVPDVLVTTPVNMRFSEEVEYVKAARELGIPTVTPVLSWDNLSTKGLFHVQPDWLLAWNQSHEEDALAYHGYRKGRVVITGSPFFDKWFNVDPALKLPREAFCKQVGLNPDYPYLVYLGSSKNIAEDETWLVREIIEAVRQHHDPLIRNLGILIRPHPANFKNYEGMESGQVALWPKAGILPDDTDARQDFINSIDHALMTVGINTSGMIDALVLGKPGATVLCDAYRKTQMEAVHFRHLMKAQVLHTAQSASGIADIARDILQEGSTLEPQRRAFLESFIRPYGVGFSAASVAGRCIEAIARGQKPQKSLPVGPSASPPPSGDVSNTTDLTVKLGTSTS